LTKDIHTILLHKHALELRERERKKKQKNEINPNKTSFLSQNSFLYNSEEKHIIRIREKLIFGIMNA
jgi:hypothetical protein